jgi:hypothetical protein
MKKIITGFIILLAYSALPQMGVTPALQNNWSYPISPSPEQVLQNGLQPIQNAVNNYSQNQYNAAAALRAETFAAKEQEERLQAAADAQQRQLESEKEIEAMRERASQEETVELFKKAQENEAVIDSQVKQVSEANQSKIEKGVNAINAIPTTPAN